jgi:hypothetical protein
MASTAAGTLRSGRSVPIRIAHLGASGDCCTAGFQTGLCRFRVIFVRSTRSRRLGMSASLRSRPNLRTAAIRRGVPRGDLSRCSNVREQSCVYSITSSAIASRFGGTSRPSALAVLRLMASSKSVGCSTGNSAGLVPRRIGSHYAVQRLSRGLIAPKLSVRYFCRLNSLKSWMGQNANSPFSNIRAVTLKLYRHSRPR